MRVRHVISAAVLAFFVLTQQYQGGEDVLHAQEGLPIIESVGPTPPQCILLDSLDLEERTLTIVGENFGNAEDSAMQFRRGGVGDVSTRFSSEANWENSTRVTVDMAHVRQYLWDYEILALNVRVSTDRYPHGFWSDEFFVAADKLACPGMRATTASGANTPRNISFPPTPPVRGVPGDHWADIILGKPDFSEAGPGQVVPFKVFNPGGVVVDRSVEPGRAYVWDSGNSRILGIDLAECYKGPSPCTADVVLGQPSGYDHSGCNRDGGVEGYPVRRAASAETLCGIPGTSISPGEEHTFVTMAVTPTGDLYVPDSHNHRVLKYESPFENDIVADSVWGQPDFSRMLCNRGEAPNAETLCFHSHTNRYALNRYGNGVDVDPDGNLWVADGGNNRVLRFPSDDSTGEIAKKADLVLGQPDFHSGEKGTGSDRLHAPSAVRVNSEGWVFVADAANDRVVVFKPPLTMGMQAHMEFGSDLHEPNSIEFDPSGQGVWINDSGNYMVELWDWDGRSVLRVLGKDRFLPDRKCGHPLDSLPGRPHPCPISGGIGIDAAGNVLVSIFLYAADVVRFSPPTDASIDGTPSLADKRLFFPPVGPNANGTKGVHTARGVAVWQDQIIVSDYGRLMFWNGLDTLSNGRPADGVVGRESFIEWWEPCCGRIKADVSGRLWTLSFEGIDFLDVYQLPLNKNSVPIHTFWKTALSFPVLDSGDRIVLGRRTFGIAPVGNGEFLWLSDTDNHRVVRIRDPLSNPVIDVILGQEEPTGTLCNRGEPVHGDRSALKLNMLCFPGALSIDRLGNLYVSDHALEVEGNWRLLIFSPELFPSHSSSVVLAPNASKVFTHSSNNRTGYLVADFRSSAMVVPQDLVSWETLRAATWEPAFDSNNRMVVGYNTYVGPSFVGLYDDPVSEEVLPTSYLYDFGSSPYTAVFDDNDNLYVGDINRGRVLVYLDRFSNPALSTTGLSQGIPALLPQYQTTITSVSPGPPYCAVRRSEHTGERFLELTVEGLPQDQNLGLEFRRVTDAHVEFQHVRQPMLRENGSRIVVDINTHGARFWPDHDRVTMTVRIVGTNREPVSNWSPAFVLVDDVDVCGISTEDGIGSLARQYDRNDDSVIDREEVIVAVIDYFFHDKLSRDEVIEIITLYSS